MKRTFVEFRVDVKKVVGAIVEVKKVVAENLSPRNIRALETEVDQLLEGGSEEEKDWIKNQPTV